MLVMSKRLSSILKWPKFIKQILKFCVTSGFQKLAYVSGNVYKQQFHHFEELCHTLFAFEVENSWCFDRLSNQSCFLEKIPEGIWTFWLLRKLLNVTDLKQPKVHFDISSASATFMPKTEVAHYIRIWQSQAYVLTSKAEKSTFRFENTKIPFQ